MPLKLPVQFNKTDPEGKQWKLLVRMPLVMMVEIPMVSIPYYENGISKDKVALLIYSPEMLIKMHLWGEDFKPENYIEKR